MRSVTIPMNAVLRLNSAAVSIPQDKVIGKDGVLTLAPRATPLPLEFRIIFTQVRRNLADALQVASDEEQTIRVALSDEANGDKIKDGNQLAFTREMSKLGATTVEVRLPDALTLADFAKFCPDVTDDELASLGPMLTIEGE